MNESTNLNDTDYVSTFLSNATSGGSRSSTEVYSAITAMLIIYLISLAGNVMICILTISIRCLRTPSSILVLNLAISDIGWISINVPFSIVVLLNDGWIFDARVCDWTGTLNVVFAGSSLWTLASIAAHRYLQLCRNQFYIRYMNLGAVSGEYAHLVQPKHDTLFIIIQFYINISILLLCRVAV